MTLERGSILVVDLDMNVTDSPEHASPTDPLSSALNSNATPSMPLLQLVKAIKYAGKDDRIKGMLIQGSLEPADFGSGYACLKELREAVLDFKKSGKQVYAYLEAPTTRDYYVCSAASIIYMNPFGEMEMPGLAVEKTYYKGALDKYGVDVQVTRVGKYKSAVEPFLLTKMSDADREETQNLINDLWGDFVDAVTRSRPITKEAFQQLVDTDGYILPEHAKSAHLVDDLKYFGDVLEELGKVAPSSDYARIPLPFKQVAIADYINAVKGRLFGERGGDKVVAILYLEGEIVDGWGEITNVGGDRFAAELRQLRKDDDVKAVVLRVNSPGGSAYASEVIQREIKALKDKKPVIVSMGNYAASGGVLDLHLQRPDFRRTQHPHRLHRRLRHVRRHPETRQRFRRHLGRGQDRPVRRFRIDLPTQDAAGTDARPGPGRRSLQQVPRQGLRQPPYPARRRRRHRHHRARPRLARQRSDQPEARR